MEDILAEYHAALTSAMPCTDRWQLTPVPAAPHRKKSTCSKTVETFYELRMQLHRQDGTLGLVTALLWANDNEHWEFVLGSRRCVCDTRGDELLGALRTALGWYNRAGYDTGHLLPGVGQWRVPPGPLADAVEAVRARLPLPLATTLMDKEGELFVSFAFPTGELTLQAGEAGIVIGQWFSEDGCCFAAGGTDAPAVFYAAMRGALGVQHG